MNTKFWDEDWLNNKPLKDVFRRLVRLESEIDANVADKLDWVGQNTVSKWTWCRTVTGRTLGELHQLELLMRNVKMNPEKEDTWEWKLNGCGKFSTQCLTKLIMSCAFPSNTTNTVTLTNNLVPKKVGVFVWRAMRNRLPVLLELDKRGIGLNSVLCPLVVMNPNRWNMHYVFVKILLQFGLRF
ncbi:uncharacterized protein [Rutidosis leptorrhynchoides]|uniref:uncharacterized protein n=1 Tax=Rutidosis leptorrhynchoides TaxID=125765 RepID=UPI003A9A66A9